MKKKIVIIGNWKMNKTPSDTMEFMKTLLSKIKKNKVEDNIFWGIATPTINITVLKKIKDDNKIDFLIGGQNMHFEKEGAFTGEISGPILRSGGATCVILGHSERRQLFKETDSEINKKIHAALQSDLMPILCVGETLQEYEKGDTEKIIKSQLDNCLRNVDDFRKIIIAYEPIWAIGTGKTATAEYAQKICSYIKSIVGENVIVQYGGSVKPNNIKSFLSMKDIDGALVGGAALDSTSFYDLLINSA